MKLDLYVKLYIATYDPLNLYKLLSIFDSQQKQGFPGLLAFVLFLSIVSPMLIYRIPLLSTAQ